MLHKALIIIFLFLDQGWRMAFLNFMKKREELPSDIDLDMPPEPPKMMKEDFSIEEPIDEELMLVKNKPKKMKERVSKAKEELPELPPLPEEEELGELPKLPPLPEEKGRELPPLLEGEGEELPPPPLIEKEKKGFFSFLKPKKAVKELELPELPPLPEEEELGELPEIPSLPEEEKEFPHLSEEKPIIPPIEHLKPEVKPIPRVKEVKEAEKPIKKYVTINDFKQIRADIGGIKDVFKGIDDVFTRLEEIKDSGDKEYAGLYNNLKDIQTKIMFVDKTLFKEENV